jgi:hypothetical protein
MYVQAACQHVTFTWPTKLLRFIINQTKRTNTRSLLKGVRTRNLIVQSELKETHKITCHHSVQTPVHS